MNVLVDTSVWSLALRRSKAAQLTADERQLARSLSDAIDEGRVTMIGPIRQEILSGIKDIKQFESLRETLQAYRDEVLETADYEAAARWFNVCRTHGVQCGPVDILICAVAVRRGWQVISNDRTMRDCLAVIRKTQGAEGKARSANQ